MRFNQSEHDGNERKWFDWILEKDFSYDWNLEKQYIWTRKVQNWTEQLRSGVKGCDQTRSDSNDGQLLGMGEELFVSELLSEGK
jgi:hypothetical protein